MAANDLDERELLSFRGISKRYGKRSVLTQVSFNIEAGERVALLGHNGTGKTTTLRVLLGLARPTSGTARLLGLPTGAEAALAHVGYCPQNVSLPPFLQVRELLNVVADLKGAIEPVELYSQFRVEGLLTRKVGELSTGQLRLVATLLAFIGDPMLVILDEPTAGLDTEHRFIIWRYTAEYCRSGGTLMLASHDFSEVSELTDRALLLDSGRLIKDGPVKDVVRLSDVTAVETELLALDNVPGAIRILHTPSRTIVLTRDPDKASRHLARQATRSVLCRPPTLEEAFLAMRGDS